MIVATTLPFLATPFETNAVTKIRLMTYDLAQKARDAGSMCSCSDGPASVSEGHVSWLIAGTVEFFGCLFSKIFSIWKRSTGVIRGS